MNVCGECPAPGICGLANECAIKWHARRKEADEEQEAG